ncbi:MAG: hypothetical protein SGARI_001595 [Bacillariaceae sp.]
MLGEAEVASMLVAAPVVSSLVFLRFFLPLPLTAPSGKFRFFSGSRRGAPVATVVKDAVAVKDKGGPKAFKAEAGGFFGCEALWRTRRRSDDSKKRCGGAVDSMFGGEAMLTTPNPWRMDG